MVRAHKSIDGGPTLLESCVRDSSNVSARVWKDYFDGFAQAGVGPEDGALPFRVWQIWEAMVQYLKEPPGLRRATMHDGSEFRRVLS